MDNRRGKRGAAMLAAASQLADAPKRPGRKSMALQRSTTPPKRKPSPGRKASPSRKPASPSRKASPARKASPVRKTSPGRRTQAVRKPSPARKASPSRKVSPVVKATVAAALAESEELRRSERIRRSETAEKILLVTKKSPVDKRLSIIMDDAEVSAMLAKSSPAKSITPNHSQRSNLITPTMTDRSRVSVSQSVSMLNDSQDFSDQEHDFQSFRKEDNGIGAGEKSYARRSATKHFRQLREFGGPIGATLLLLFIPLYVFAVNHFCSGVAHRNCVFTIPKNWDEFKSVSTYFNKDIAAIYMIFIWLVPILSVIPVGKVVRTTDESRGENTFKFTGMVTALGTGLLMFVTEYCYKYPLISLISKGYNQLLVLGILGALLTSVLALLKSRMVEQLQWNPYGKTGNLIYDCFAGRELNPVTFGVFNLKLVHYHLAVIQALVFNAIILYRNLHFAPLPDTTEPLPLLQRIIFAGKNVTAEPVPVLAATLTILYLLDLLAYEHHLSSSFELQQEGFGAQYLLRYAVFPFTLTLLPKYVAAHKLSEVPIWMMVVCTLIAIAGLVIKRSSQRMKHLYRLDPNGEKGIHLDTLPTFQGRRLLVAKWWRIVRQPNYAGDILQNVALLPLLYWRFAWPPLLAVLFTVLILVHRAKRLSDRNAKTYNSAWQRYCSIVRYMLIPKVY